MEKDIRKLISELTTEEKAALCSGFDNWHTAAVPRLGIPAIMVADGPHGLRKQSETTGHLGVNRSIEAPCFPSAAGTAASFDRELMYSLGEVLGEECTAQELAVLLGPAINIKRSPLCGRNFEYLSEDPYLVGELSAAYINGVQSYGVGTSMKHFALNNQETRRLSVSANLTERTMREIYLAGFETAVKKAQPYTIMSSYNRVNGKYLGEDRRILTDILRGEWDFHGLVVSDWGAVNERVDALKAGLDLEMPGGNKDNTRKILAAIEDGSLDMETLELAVERVLKLVLKTLDAKKAPMYDRMAHHAKAREIARESMVLLKNDGTLPLNKNQKICFIGPFAKNPRFQGGGSSHINTEHVVSALDAINGSVGVEYYAGLSDDLETPDDELLTLAIEGASACDVAVIFAGLPESYESEGFDREHMDMPEAQNALISAIADTGVKTVVVLHNGSPVTMPWIDDVSAVLESYLGGEAVGEAQIDILFGDFNPCGKLPESFPVKLSDTPSYLNFPGIRDNVDYAEGVYVGYRYYATKRLPVLFPFGHGLSYTSFEYSDIRLDKNELRQGESLTVSFNIKNTGSVAGKEAAQLYISPDDHSFRPVIELKGFEKVSLEPGESKNVSVTLPPRAFAYYDEEYGWLVMGGSYEILIGASSEDIRLNASVLIDEPVLRGWRVNPNTIFGDVLANPLTRAIIEQYVQNAPSGGLEGLMSPEGLKKFLAFMPLRGLRSFAKLDNAEMLTVIDQMNAALEASE